jgi:hypothetical protein
MADFEDIVKQGYKGPPTPPLRFGSGNTQTVVKSNTGIKYLKTWDEFKKKLRNAETADEISAVIDEYLLQQATVDDLYTVLDYAIAEGKMKESDAEPFITYHYNRLAYDSLSPENKAYLQSATSIDDLRYKVNQLGLSSDIAGAVSEFVYGERTPEEWAVIEEAESLYQEQADYEREQRRKSLFDEFNRAVNFGTNLSTPPDLSSVRQRLNDAVQMGDITWQEANQYLNAFQESVGQYQQGPAGALNELYNNKYLTPEDFAKYSRPTEKAVGYTPAGELQYERNLMTPEEQQVMVRELSSLAMKRQAQEQELQRLETMMGATVREPIVNMERMQAPSAGNLITQYKEGQPQYAQGSRLQQLMDIGINRTQAETAAERARHFGAEYPITTYEEAQQNYRDKLSKLQSFFDVPELAEKAQQEYDVLSGQLKNLDAGAWGRAAEDYRWRTANDPLELGLKKLKPEVELRGLTASQRGQNVSRFAPRLRF